MKKFIIIIWFLFSVAAIMRFTHAPGGALLLIISVFLLLVHAVITAFRNRKENLVTTFFFFTVWIWTTYLLFRVQYWPYSWEVLTIATLISPPWIVLALTGSTKLRPSDYILFVYALLSFGLMFVPSHRIYYACNLTETFHSSERKYGYNAWDKYSYLLYLDERYDDAATANLQAGAALTEIKRYYYDETIQQDSIEIAEHAEMIREKMRNEVP